MESVNNIATEAPNTTLAVELGSNTSASQHPISKDAPHLSETQKVSDKSVTHIEGGESPSLKELREIVREMYPKLYVGHESMDRSLFEALKEHSHSNTKDKHCEALQPLAEGLKNFIELVEKRDNRGEEHFGAQLTNEINEAIQDQRVTYKWLNNALDRYLAFISKDYCLSLAPELQDLMFSDLNKYIRSNAWRQPGEIEMLKNKFADESDWSDLQKRVLKLIAQHPLAPRVTKYPFFNQGVLGIGTIMEVMVEGIGPQGVPSTAEDVHGLSPASRLL